MLTGVIKIINMESFDLIGSFNNMSAHQNLSSADKFCLPGSCLFATDHLFNAVTVC